MLVTTTITTTASSTHNSDTMVLCYNNSNCLTASATATITPMTKATATATMTMLATATLAATTAASTVKSTARYIKSAKHSPYFGMHRVCRNKRVSRPKVLQWIVWIRVPLLLIRPTSILVINFVLWSYFASFVPDKVVSIDAAVPWIVARKAREAREGCNSDLALSLATETRNESRSTAGLRPSHRKRTRAVTVMYQPTYITRLLPAVGNCSQLCYYVTAIMYAYFSPWPAVPDLIAPFSTSLLVGDEIALGLILFCTYGWEWKKTRSKYPSGGFCAAWGCSNRQTKGDGKKYHRFPRDPTRRKQWAAALKREGFVATEYSRICSDHFTKESYNGSGRLNCSAVPTVFNFPDHLRVQATKSPSVQGMCGIGCNDCNTTLLRRPARVTPARPGAVNTSSDQGAWILFEQSSQDEKESRCTCSVRRIIQEKNKKCATAEQAPRYK
ncbi:THAP domain containing 6 [Plakobranchus ocellatus]|uniref:THAP domain containing 6 n=1 Tax=Plakobranchus ocellatus TaxID=259542 RepID=A0AAV3YHA1_9GAST|nr:THAP domain containing 6 [Plakobranchus ocellatus]